MEDLLIYNLLCFTNYKSFLNLFKRVCLAVTNFERGYFNLWQKDIDVMQLVEINNYEHINWIVKVNW